MEMAGLNLEAKLPGIIVKNRKVEDDYIYAVRRG
jgi:hypothetical protein